MENATSLIPKLALTVCFVVKGLFALDSTQFFSINSINSYMIVNNSISFTRTPPGKSRFNLMFITSAFVRNKLLFHQ